MSTRFDAVTLKLGREEGRESLLMEKFFQISAEWNSVTAPGRRQFSRSGSE